MVVVGYFLLVEPSGVALKDGLLPCVTPHHHAPTPRVQQGTRTLFQAVFLVVSQPGQSVHLHVHHVLLTFAVVELLNLRLFFIVLRPWMPLVTCVLGCV